MSLTANRPESRVGPEPTRRAICDHGDVVFGIDPDPIYFPSCFEDGVFWVPTPVNHGPLWLCPYHLARYLEDADDELAAKLVERGADHYAADPAFVTIDDAPADVEILGKRWELLSIDQRGHAHYLRPGDAIVELLPTFEVPPEGRTSLEETTIRDHMEQLRRERGFAAFAPGTPLPTGGRA